MLDLIGENPAKAVRKIEKTPDDKQNDNIIISSEKLALKSLHQNFYDNYKITEELSINCISRFEIRKWKCARILDKSLNLIFMIDRKIKMLINLSHTNIIKIYQILEDENIYI